MKKKDSGIPIGALYSQQNLNQLDQSTKLNLLATFANSSASTLATIDKNTAISLGKSLPPTTNFSQCVAVLSSVPIQIINNAKPQDIINNIGKMDVDNMDPSRIGLIAAKVFTLCFIQSFNK